MPTYAFYKHLDTLIDQTRRQGASACVPGAAKRPWNIPPAFPLNGLDVEDPQFFITACDRTELNAMAIASYETGNEANAGRVGIVMAAKKAIDYQSTYERALRGRYASAVTRRVWAMARRTGHGSSTYGIYGIIRSDLDDTLNESTAQDNSPR